MSEMQKIGLLVATEVVKAVLVVSQVGEAASLAAAAEGLLLRVAWLAVGACLAVGEACLAVEGAYPVGADRQPGQEDPLEVRLGKEASLLWRPVLVVKVVLKVVKVVPVLMAALMAALMAVLVLMVVLTVEPDLTVKLVLAVELVLMALVKSFLVEPFLAAYPFLVEPGLALQEVQSHLWLEQVDSVQGDVRRLVFGFPRRRG
jgi:hypothetical protein